MQGTRILPLSIGQRPPVPPPLVGPLADNDRLVELIAAITHRRPDGVRHRLEAAEKHFGGDVNAELRLRGIAPYVWTDKLARFYAETDAFLYELVAHNRTPAKLAMRSWIANFLRQAPIDSLDVLAFGDGLGFDSLHLAQAGHQVTYLEVAGFSRQFAERIFAEARAAIRVVGDVEEIQPQSFDAVLCLDVLEHVPDPPAVIASLARRLRPGGFLIVSAPFFMIVPEFPTHLRANLRFSGQIDRLYGPAGLQLADGRFGLDPVVLVKRPAASRGAWRGAWRRALVRLGALLISAARWWSWPHIVIGRYLQNRGRKSTFLGR